MSIRRSSCLEHGFCGRAGARWLQCCAQRMQGVDASWRLTGVRLSPLPATCPQAQHDYLAGNYPVVRDDAAQMAALQMQARNLAAGRLQSGLQALNSSCQRARLSVTAVAGVAQCNHAPTHCP